MKFYLIQFNEMDYDQFDSFVMVGKDEDGVIALLKEQYPDKKYGKVDWKSGYTVSELKIEDFKDTTVILGSYNAG